MTYIGALGVNTFDDEIEEATNSLTNLIITEDILQAGYSSNYTNKHGIFGSNYVLSTSNILIGRIVSDINDTSNYVKITSNILEARIKALEGTEGSSGDVNLGIPSIPSTGAIAVAAAIATVTAACISANGITVLTLLDILEDKVDLNRIEADKIGGWSSNYSDTVGVWGSNYVLSTSNILIKRITDEVGYTSNYVWNTSNILVKRITDEVGYTSNYVWNTSNILVTRLTDEDKYTSNYVLNTSNILVKRITDEADFTSNYVNITSNILVKRITDEADFTSNYVKITSNILVKRITDEVGFGSNYVLNTSNILVKRITDEVGFGSNYVLNTSNILVKRITDEIGFGSNYVLNTSNIVINRIMREVGFGSNYTERLIAAIPSSTNYWTTSGTNDIYLNQAGSVGIGTNTPQNKLHIYNATSSALRLETTTTGTASVIFQRGTTTDIRTDYRIINDADILKFQYQDNLINFGATASDIMWVYDKRTEFIKDGYFKGSMGIGMLPNVNALSITGDTYMDGSLGINTSAGSYPLDVYGDVNIDGDVGIGANPSAGVKLYVSGTTRLGGSVGIGVAPTSYALDIIGSARVDGYVGIGTIPSSSTYRLDILGNFRTQGGIVSTGIIQAGNGLTASGGLITASAGISSTTLTTSGLITATNATTGTSDSLNIQYNTSNGIRFQQQYIGTDDVRYDLIQKVANVDKSASLTFYNGNVGIGTTNPSNILQVGLGRLRISNGTPDHTIIGTSDVGTTIGYTRILLNGYNTYMGAPYNAYGNIFYVATNSGSHIFATQTGTTPNEFERMRIGNNGNVAIGTTDTATYKVNVAGSINATSLFLNGTAFTGGSKWTTATDTTRIYYNAGNVGIGTTNPIARLHINHTSTATNADVGVIGLYVYNPTNSAGQNSIICNRVAGNSSGKILYSFDVSGHYGYSIYLAANNSALKFNNNWEGSGTDVMRLNANGAVGIQAEWNSSAQTGGYAIANNLMNTAGSLTIGNVNQNYGGQSGGVGNISGFMMECLNNTEMSVHDYGQVIHSFMYYSGSTFRIGRNMGWGVGNVYFSGFVRMESYLLVSGTIQAFNAYYFPNDLWNNSNDGQNRVYYASNSTTYIRGTGTGGGANVVNFRNEYQSDVAYIAFTSLLYCYGPINLSDRRIKRDIEEINDETALNMLLLVQPTTYYYRDETRNRGNGKVYGFIAQQIKEVIPDAVHTTKEIIANIYKTCLVYNKREIYHSIPQDVAIDTEVQIFKAEGVGGDRYKIKEIYEDHFIIDKDIDGDECFVYGYCVDDLHGLDKSYIYTLNVCATQELHRRIEAQKVIIQSQDERIRELEEKMVDILKYLSL